MKNPQSPRTSLSARRRRSVNSAKLRCERIEDRITPALFNAQTALSFAAGTMNTNGCVATADFNKDGRMDAVVTNYGTNENNNDGTTIVQLMGRATPGFNVRSISTGGSNVSFVSVADINNDTWPDLLVSNGNQQSIGSVSVFRNDANGAGTMTLAGTFPTGGNNACWVGAADFTGDGVLDVAVAHFGRNISTSGEANIVGNNITVFQGNADGTGHGDFTYNGPIATLAPTVAGIVTMIPTCLALADFDGDTFVDIVAVSPGIPPDNGAPYPEGSVYTFKGNGTGGFAAPNQVDSGGIFPVNVQAADMNGDGKKDLVIANTGDPGPLNQLTYSWTGNSISVLPNVSTSGNPQFDFAMPFAANIRGPFATAITDYNLDGKADIAAINYGAPDGPFVIGPKDAFVTVYLGNATVPGQFAFTLASPPEYDTLTGDAGGQYLAVGDFDGNSTPDLITAHDNNKIGLLFNTSVPTAVPAVDAAVVNGGQTDTTQRSRVTSLTVTFNTQVTFAGAIGNAFTLTRNGGGAVTFTATASVVGGVTVVTLNNFSGAEAQFGSLRDGKYTLTALATQISANGQQMASNFTFGEAQGLFRFYGDMNADRRVDISDFGFFSAAYLQGTGANNPALDFNGDGRIDISDFGEFSVRYFTTLP